MKDLLSKPNQITYIRILLIPIFVIFLLMEMPYRNYIAAFIFIILSLSDALDGYIARKKNQVTQIGKIIDPIADKLLISAALIFLIGRVQLWMAVIIIVRELVITVARLFFLPKKVVIGASKLGKIKTVSQIVAIVVVILNINIHLSWWLMLIAVIITVVSGFDYLIKMGKFMGENVLNIPNIITTFRLLLIPLFVINLVRLNIKIALVTFTIIILLDKLDGISARIAKQITKFGRIYDAFTDFTLILSSYIALSFMGLLESFWIVTFIIPSLVLIATKISSYVKFKEVSSSDLGKVVVGISYVAIISVIINEYINVYKFQILVLIAVLAYIYMIIDVYKSFKIHKSKSKFF